MWRKTMKAEPSWKMKDGSLIRIADMEDEHLFNVMRMLYRQSVREMTIGTLCTPEPSGQHALDAYNSERDQWDDAPPRKVMDAFKPMTDPKPLFDELERRGFAPEEWFLPADKEQAMSEVLGMYLDKIEIRGSSPGPSSPGIDHDQR